MPTVAYSGEKKDNRVSRVSITEKGYTLLRVSGLHHLLAATAFRQGPVRVRVRPVQVALVGHVWVLGLMFSQSPVKMTTVWKGSLNQALQEVRDVEVNLLRLISGRAAGLLKSCLSQDPESARTGH